MKIISKAAAIGAMAILGACAGSGHQECHVSGTLPSAKWDGQYVFFVPMTKTDSLGVDSVKIAGNTFDYVTTRSMTFDIRLSWRTRYGIESLLMVAEPGNVAVRLDSVSSCVGTPLNDSLEVWKDRCLENRRTLGALTVAYRNFYAEGDSVKGDLIKQQARDAAAAHRQRTIKLADDVAGTPLADFLNNRILNRKTEQK